MTEQAKNTLRQNQSVTPFSGERVNKKPLSYRFVKRTFDIAFSSCVIVIGFIPSLVLSAIIAHDTGGAPLYSEERIGKNGKPFKIYKFRSMYANAQNVEKYFNEEQLALWSLEKKVQDDPRITKLGKFLRSTSIDEFPQFINVFLGQISTIGCRAITAEELRWFGHDVDLLLSVPPGITGAWQIGPRNAATFESGLRQKCELNYASNANLALDAKIFFSTLPVMIKRTGR